MRALQAPTDLIRQNATNFVEAMPYLFWRRGPVLIGEPSGGAWPSPEGGTGSDGHGGLWLLAIGCLLGQ